MKSSISCQETSCNGKLLSCSPAQMLMLPNHPILNYLRQLHHVSCQWNWSHLSSPATPTETQKLSPDSLLKLNLCQCALLLFLSILLINTHLFSSLLKFVDNIYRTTQLPFSNIIKLRSLKSALVSQALSHPDHLDKTSLYIFQSELIFHHHSSYAL